MGAINSQYPVLFNQGGYEGEGQDGEGDDPEEDSGHATFTEKWGWVALVDGVSDTLRCEWDKVWMMPAIEFLNIVCYRKDKAEEEKREIEKWKKRN